MTESSVPVTVVIVTYRSHRTIREALESHRQAHQERLIRVVVVDNASDDGTADLVSECFPWVRLIRSGTNLGYGRGCNLGFREVNTPYVLIMNPDAVLSVDALQTLLAFMDSNPRVGITGPAICENGSRLQPAGLMTTPGTLWREALGKREPYLARRVINPGERPFRTDWICGAIMLMRSSLFRELNGFDPRFFLYFEETDLCRRAVERDAEIWAVGEAVASHVGGESMGDLKHESQSSYIPEHFFRSRFYYLVKHFGWTQAIAAEVIASLARSLRQCRRKLVGSRVPEDTKAVRSSTPFLKFPAQPSDTA